MDNGITYREENGYLIPNIALSYDTMPVGHYGMLLNQELLYPHCLEIELQAKAYIAEALKNIPTGYTEEEMRRLAHENVMATLISSDWRRPRPTQNRVR